MLEAWHVMAATKHTDRPIQIKPIPSFRGYMVGTDGSVWSLMQSRGFGGGQKLTDTLRQLRQHANRNGGHRDVCLSRDGKVKQAFVHRLVLETFVGPCLEGMECRHLDGDPGNNRLENLRWGTRQENAADCIRHGRRPRGQEHGRAILTAEQVAEIRSAAEQGEKSGRIAKRFGTTAGYVRRIVTRKTWQHI